MPRRPADRRYTHLLVARGEMTKRPAFSDLLAAVALVAALAIAIVRFRHPQSALVSEVEHSTAALLRSRPETLRVASLSDPQISQVLDLRSDSSTLVLIFSATCAACSAIRHSWESFADSMPIDIRVVGLTADSDGGEDYFHSRRIRVLRVASRTALRQQIPAGFVPVTMAVRSGQVLDAHIGVADRERLAQVRTRLLRANSH